MSEKSIGINSKTDWERIDNLTDEEIAEAIRNDPDAADLREDFFGEAAPASEVVPQIVEAYRRGRGPQKKPAKTPVSIRLNQDVVDYFRAQGKGWQTRINEVLEEYVTSQD